MAMIDCADVRFTYDGRRFALDGAAVSIEQGEFVCILGGNGSGKSTLAKHMNALLTPDEGTVRVDGLDASDAQNAYAIRATAGMVFQNPDDQLVASLVEDDVAFGPENLGIEPSEIARRVHDALAEVGLSGFERHETHALSGGQKQRVAIAGVLAMEPKVLILDEASSMLDPRGRRGLMRVCKELHEKGMTVVAITHFMEEAAEADRVVVLEGGRVACQGTPDEVLSRADVLTRLNLEVPFACALTLELRKRGVEAGVHVHEESAVRAIARIAATTREDAGAQRESGSDAASEPELPGQPAQPSQISQPGQSARSCQPAQPEQASAARKARPQSGGQEGQTPSAQEDAACDGEKGARQPLIAFDHVSYSYLDAKSKKRAQRKKDAAKQAKWGNSPDAVWALHDVSMSVYEGEFLGIAGHTGSGKSTLIQHMNGLLHPDVGCVSVRGADLSDKKNAIGAREQVGVVFQYPEHQLFAATVYDDVAFGPRNMGLDEDEVAARVREGLSLVGLDYDALREMSPFELSGGQQRRVAFAGVLAMRPKTLVLDEPVAGLDPAARREFLALIDRLHAGGLTIVMVSHSMEDLAAHCDRIAVFKEGRLAALGTPQEIFSHPDKLNAVGLGLPAPQRMARALREAGIALPDGVLYDKDSLASAIARALGAQADAHEGAGESAPAQDGRLTDRARAKADDAAPHAYRTDTEADAASVPHASRSGNAPSANCDGGER